MCVVCGLTHPGTSCCPKDCMSNKGNDETTTVIPADVAQLFDFQKNYLKKCPHPNTGSPTPNSQPPSAKDHPGFSYIVERIRAISTLGSGDGWEEKRNEEFFEIITKINKAIFDIFFTVAND